MLFRAGGGGLALALAILSSSAAPSAQASQSPQAKSGVTVNGRVQLDDQRPVRRAHVGVTGPVSIVTDTDTEGRFSLENLPNGSYQVAVTKTGFIQSAPAILNVTAATRPSGLLVPMEPGGVVTGLVLDPASSPLSNVTLLLTSAGRAVVSRTATDDRGIFRFHTLPRCACHLFAATQRVGNLPSNGAAGLNGVYYPNVTEPSDAEVLTIVPGQALDLRLVLDARAEMFTPPGSSQALVESGDAKGNATISGRITGVETAAAIAGVIVQLASQDLRRVATTNAAGQFEFTKLPAGRYSLVATPAPGYAFAAYIGMPQAAAGSIVVKADEVLRTADIQMPSTKTLAGRVVDEFGDAAPDVEVVISQRLFVFGALRLTPSRSALTNDLGEFRVGSSPPGEYFLSTLSGPFGSSGPQQEPRSGNGFGLTFFPGTDDATRAQPIVIPLRGLPEPANFSLVPARLVNVAGRVIGADGKPSRNASVEMVPLYDGDVRVIAVARAVSGTDGSYQIKNVPVGSYVVRARDPGFGSLTSLVTPDNSTITDLRVFPPITIRGRLIFEGEPGPALAKQVVPMMVPTSLMRNPMGAVSPSNVKEDGTFEVLQLVGQNRLIPVAPASWMMAGISRHGEDVTDRVFDARDGDVDDLEILFTRRTNSVVCQVADSAGKKLMSGFVIFFADDPGHWVYPSRFMRVVGPDAQGDFTARSLPPAVYRAVPFDRAPRPDWVSPEFLQTLRGKGEQFSVNYGDALTIQLVLRK